MPVVPTYDVPRQKLDPGLNFRDNTRASGEMFGSQVGQALSQVGKGVADVGDAINAVNQQNQVNAAKDAHTRTMSELNDLGYGENGYYRQQGRNAVEGGAAYERGVQDIIKRNAQGLDPMAQQIYSRAAAESENSAIQGARQFQIKQSQAWSIETSGARIEEFANNALTRFGNPDEVQKNVSAGIMELRQQAPSLGWDDKTLRQKELGLTSWVYKNITLKISQTDALKAQQFAKENERFLSGTDRLDLDKNLKEGVDTQVGTNASRDALAGIMTGTIPPVSMSDPSGAKAYLSAVSAHPDRPGDTSNIAPGFATRLAGAIREARSNGLELSLMSGYRSPTETTSQGRNDSASRYDAAGYSLHDKGGAADISGLDGPSGAKTKQWAQIAAKWGIFNPYGVDNPREFNHWQAVDYKLEDRPDVLALIQTAGADQSAIWQAIEGNSGAAYPRFSLSAMTSAVIGQESGGNPDIGASIDGAMGPAQIMPGTFKEYALPGEDINVPADNEKVAGRIIQAYARKYGNDPARIAVAYFSGEGNVAPPGSAAPYIADKKDGNGKSVSSYVADVLNRYGIPTQGMPTNVATNEGGALGVSGPDNGTGTPNVMAFNGGNQNSIAAPFIAAPQGPPQATFEQVAASPEMRKAAAYQAIQDRTDLTDAQKKKALQDVNQQISQDMIIQQATDAAKKDANDAAADGYIKRIMKRDIEDIIPSIMADPSLQWQTREHLAEAAMKYSGSDANATADYGTGFWDAFKAVTAPAGDPGRVTDVNAVLSRVGPNGDLTLAGAGKIIATMQTVRKDATGSAVMTAKAGLINYAKSKLSFDQAMTIGGQQMKDPVGEAIFNAQFIPKFEAAFDKWVTDGKDPFEFLTKGRVDDMARDLRDPFAMAAARVGAQIQSGDETAAQNTPPVPDKAIEPTFWNEAAASPPISGATGQPMPNGKWAASLAQLLRHPELAPQFDEAMARGGFDYRAKNIFAVHDASMKQAGFGPYAEAPPMGTPAPAGAMAPAQKSPAEQPKQTGPSVFSWTK